MADPDPKHSTSKKLEEDIERYGLAILSTLSNHSMSADDLISHLLAENYGNTDKESDLILIALNRLIKTYRLKVDRVIFNANKKAVTLLTIFSF